jgi:hypothetical protein
MMDRAAKAGVVPGHPPEEPKPPPVPQRFRPGGMMDRLQKQGLIADEPPIGFYQPEAPQMSATQAAFMACSRQAEKDYWSAVRSLYEAAASEADGTLTPDLLHRLEELYCTGSAQCLKETDAEPGLQAAALSSCLHPTGR